MTKMAGLRDGRAILEWGEHGRTELTWREAGAGRTVVLLHCYPVDGRLFAAQLDAAARGDLPALLVIPDLPGFGRSPLPERPGSRYTVAELGKLLRELVATLGGRPILGGVAIGGSAAVAAVADGCPADGLVLVSNRLGRDLPRMAAQRAFVIRRARSEGASSLAAELAAAALSPTVTAGVRRRVERMIADAAPEAIAALTQGIAERPDVGDVLGRVDVPTLIVAGADDPWSPPTEAARLAQRISESVLHAVGGSGHMVPIERPRAVTSALREFVSSLAARPTEGPPRAGGT